VRRYYFKALVVGLIADFEQVHAALHGGRHEARTQRMRTEVLRVKGLASGLHDVGDDATRSDRRNAPAKPSNRTARLRRARSDFVSAAMAMTLSEVAAFLRSGAEERKGDDEAHDRDT
jgi:hypothetical protein